MSVYCFREKIMYYYERKMAIISLARRSLKIRKGGSTERDQMVILSFSFCFMSEGAEVI